MYAGWDQNSNFYHFLTAFLYLKEGVKTKIYYDFIELI